MRRKQGGLSCNHHGRALQIPLFAYNTPVGRRQGALKAKAKAKTERSHGEGESNRSALREIEAFDAQLGLQIPAIKPRKTTQHLEEDS